MRDFHGVRDFRSIQKRFDDRQDNFNRRFNSMWSMVKTIIIIGFLMIIAWWGFMGFVAYKATDVATKTDFSDGIKPVLEKIWCGEPGCLDKK